jgi:hypothetical protein
VYHDMVMKVTHTSSSMRSRSNRDPLVRIKLWS